MLRRAFVSFPAITLLLLVFAVSCGAGDDEDAQARVWEPFEITLDGPVDMENPFDPAQANLSATFNSPSGESIAVAGFVSRDYTRKLADEKEVLTPDGDLQWKIRFTPTEPGDWTWRWSLRTAEGVTDSERQALHVEEASADVHGFLRVSPDDSRYLRFEDGAQYFAIGENLAWYSDRGTYDYDDWFAKLAARGVNYVRLWMPSWAFGLEWTEPNTLGNYTERLGRAWQLDYVLQQAAKHGIYVLLNVQNHGPFSLTANSEWDKNPYNAANSGPLQQPQEVFTNQDARQLFERRLHYIVARWGASPNVLGWELWNEVDLSSTSMADVLPWHEQMSTYLRDIDPYDHLISTSTSLPWGIAAVSATDLTSFDSPLFDFWRMPNIDFSQIHIYAIGGSSIDFSELLPDMSTNLRRFAKPVLVAEAGVDPTGPDETIAADPGGLGFHDMLWAGLFAQTMGTGMTWWWDNVIDSEELYSHFGPLATITKGVSFDMEGFAASELLTTSGSSTPVRGRSLTGKSVALVWLKNENNQWFAPDKSEVEGSTVTLDGLGEGMWHATWLNTYSDEVLAEDDLDVAASGIQLRVPAFERDIALRLDKK